jgi:hypothetical protein
MNDCPLVPKPLTYDPSAIRLGCDTFIPGGVLGFLPERDLCATSYGDRIKDLERRVRELERMVLALMEKRRDPDDLGS